MLPKKGIYIILAIAIALVLLLYVCMRYLNYKEHFSLPNFIKITPDSENAPATVLFTPIYINEESPFTIDFGDGSPEIEIKNNELYEHEYKKAGEYKGIISFHNSCVTQKFNINLK